MGSVTLRRGTSVSEGGRILHDDTPMDWSDADKLAGTRLDRRKAYAVINGGVCELAKWTDYCTGCTEYSEGYRHSGPFGCDECGYTGKRRRAEWVPINGEQFEKMMSAIEKESK